MKKSHIKNIIREEFVKILKEQPHKLTEGKLAEARIKKGSYVSDRKGIVGIVDNISSDGTIVDIRYNNGKQSSLPTKQLKIFEGKFFRLPSKLNAMWNLKNSVNHMVDKHDNGDDYDPAEMKTIEEFIKKIKKSIKAFKSFGDVQGTIYESRLNEVGEDDTAYHVALALMNVGIDYKNYKQKKWMEAIIEYFKEDGQSTVFIKNMMNDDDFLMDTIEYMKELSQKKKLEGNLTETNGYTVVYRDIAFDKTYTAQIPPGISKAEIKQMLKRVVPVGLEIINISPIKESVNEADFTKTYAAAMKKAMSGDTRLLAQMFLSPTEYQKAKKMKGFDVKDWKWNSNKGIYRYNEPVDEASLDPLAKKLLSLIQTSNRSIKNLDDITVQATTKGNWAVLYKGKSLVTIQGKYLNDKTIEKYGLREAYTSEWDPVQAKKTASQVAFSVRGKLKAKKGNVTYKQAMSTKDIEAKILKHVQKKHGAMEDARNLSNKRGRSETNIITLYKLAKKTNDRDLLNMLDSWFTIAHDNNLVEGIK